MSRGIASPLAAYDVHRAREFGRTEPRTRLGPFTTLGHPGHEPRTVRHHIPAHPSSLNQVESYFCSVEANSVTPWGDGRH
ncbi:hypothetical protein ACQ4WX_48670 [Streptomyces lasalocidi]